MDFEIKDNKLVKYNGNASEVVIPDSVTVIGASAFKGCTSLESVTIPNSVKEIGRHAFEGCTSLEKITLPAGVKYKDIVEGCTSLKDSGEGAFIDRDKELEKEHRRREEENETKMDFTKLRGMQFAGHSWDYEGGAESGILRFTYETRDRRYADQRDFDSSGAMSFTPSERSLLRSVDAQSVRYDEAPPMARHNLSGDYEVILTTIQITISVEDFLEKIDHSCYRF